MVLNYRFLSFGWLGGTSLGGVGGGGYWAYDTANPRVSQWLLGSGYILNPPKFTSHESQSNYCQENLFKQDSNFDPTKAYGCRFESLDIWNERKQKQEKSTDFLTFVDQLTVRNGNKGWQITSLIDTRDSIAKHIRIVVYEFDKGSWTVQKTFVTANEPKIDNKKSQENKTLKLVSKGTTLYQWDNTPTDGLSSGDSQKPKLSEVWKERKLRSWIWIEKRGGKSGVLNNSSATFISSNRTNHWNHGSSYLSRFPEATTLSFDAAHRVNSLYNDKLGLKRKMGEWLETKELCGLSNRRKWSVNKDQRKNLKIYCSKPKSKD